MINIMTVYHNERTKFQHSLNTLPSVIQLHKDRVIGMKMIVGKANCQITRLVQTCTIDTKD